MRYRATTTGYRPSSASSGAEKIARIPPAINAVIPQATTSETRSRSAGAAADLSLGRTGIGGSIQASSRPGAARSEETTT